VNLSEQQRADSEAGFERAAKEMITNLDEQLSAFRERVKERPTEFKVQASSGYRGGGAFDASMLVLVAVLGGGFLWMRRRHA